MQPVTTQQNKRKGDKKLSAPETTVYQHNFKVNNDLHNVYAANGAESVELLNTFAEDVLPAIMAVNEKIRALGAIVAPAASSASAAAPATPPAGDGAAPLCEHGSPAKLIPAGIAKSTGKPYRAFYACAQQRGMQCNFKAQV